MDFTIRWASNEDWEEAMEMVWKTFLKFDAPDCTPEGQASFRAFITDANLRRAFEEGKYQMLTAWDKGQIVGVGSLRDGNHLSLLFVEETHHHNGIGRAMVEFLCDYLAREVGVRHLSLLASPYAVEFYKKLGFTQVKPGSRPAGVPVVLMQKDF